MLTDELNWQETLNLLQNSMSRATFNTWLLNTTATLRDGRLIIYTPSIYALETLKSRLRKTIQTAVQTIYQAPLELEFALRTAEPPPAPTLPPQRGELEGGEADELDLLTANEILTTDWPEPIWAIPGLLPVGLTILAGKPKMGKSWLILQLAKTIAAGSQIFGSAVEPGRVLYLALEDPPRRLRERMRMQRWPTDLPVDFMVMGQFIHQIGDLSNEGGQRLARQIQNRQYRLVAIDTLSRSVEGDQNDVEIMTRALIPIHEMAHAKNCAVLLCDHHNKASGVNPDAIADILGSTAKGALCDTAWGLYRQRGQNDARLSVVGREVIERTLAMSINWETGLWQDHGDAAKLTDRHQEILDVLEYLDRPTLNNISRVLNQDPSNTYKRLKAMLNGGLLKKDIQKREILYHLNGHDPEE